MFFCTYVSRHIIFIGGENLKSIKEHQSDKSSFSLQNILGQSLWYAMSSILSVSVMSGFGLPWNYDSTKVSEWLNPLQDRSAENIVPENLAILRAVYKKGDPHYNNAYNGNRNDYQNFLWSESSFKKVITPTSQSYLIMDEVMLAKYLYNGPESELRSKGNLFENKDLSLILMNSAILQCQFMSDYLRNGNGLFISKLDITQNQYGEPDLEIAEKTPVICEQAFALEAFSMVSRFLKNDENNVFHNSKMSESAGKLAEQIYDMFQDSPEDVYGSKTRDLCSIISSCIQYYKSNEDDGTILNYITMLCLELESRIDMSGNVLRLPDEDSFTSSSSSFMVMKTLIQAYRVTGIYKFQSSASLLYKKLNLLWSPSCSLYLLDDDDKYKYTLRDVGSVLGGLNAVRLFGEDELRDEAKKKLMSFFNSAVNTSGIVQASVSPPSADHYENFCHPGIPECLEVGIAPVFAKKFTYKPKKHKFNINSSAFYSDYALYTANEMLCMNYPGFDCF